MKPVVTLLCPLVLAFALPSAGVPAETAASPEIGRLTATRQANLIVIGGDHFRVQVDAAKGGEITAIQLFDGSDWNRVVGGDGKPAR